MTRQILCDEAVTNVERLDQLVASGRGVLAMLHDDGDVWRQTVAGLSQQQSLLDYLDRKDVTVISVDINRAPQIAQQLRYLSSPHLVGFKEGEKIGEYLGYNVGSGLRAELVSWYGH